LRRATDTVPCIIVALQPPIVPRIRHTGDTRNFFEYPEQNWQSWYEKAADTVKLQVLQPKQSVALIIFLSACVCVCEFTYLSALTFT